MSILSKLVINISGTAIVRETKNKIKLVQCLKTRYGELYLDTDDHIWTGKDLKYIRCKIV